MLEIIDNDITLTRGDTAVIDFSLDNYEVATGDSIVLTVKKTVNDTTNVFQKTLDVDNAQFVIEHNDTKDLAYGKYMYDIQLTTAEGKVFTVITPHYFVLDSEVTF